MTSYVIITVCGRSVMFCKMLMSCFVCVSVKGEFLTMGVNSQQIQSAILVCIMFAHGEIGLMLCGDLCIFTFPYRCAGVRVFCEVVYKYIFVHGIVL